MPVVDAAVFTLWEETIFPGERLTNKRLHSLEINGQTATILP
jgi:hypothetical protein